VTRFNIIHISGN